MSVNPANQTPPHDEGDLAQCPSRPAGNSDGELSVAIVSLPNEKFGGL